MSNIYSNAFNFSSFMGGEVDIRTGLYSAVVKLCTLKSIYNNDLSRDINLTYSLMNTQSHGFGIGWGLSGVSGCAQNEVEHWVLTLSDGRSFQVADINDAFLAFNDKKLKDFFVTRDDERTLSIVYKNGSTETLKRLSSSGAYYLSELVFESGEAYQFNYDSTQEGFLTAVMDTDSNTLLSLEYNSELVRSAQIAVDADRLAKVAFSFSNALLVSVTMPAESVIDWNQTIEFEYNVMGNFSALAKLTSPMGGVQTIQYQENGTYIEYTSCLPNVTKWVVTPAHGQSDIVKEYTYSTETNFLGYQSGVSHDYGEDNLYQLITEYNYWGQETVVDPNSGDCLSQKKVDFNKFHLVIKEEQIEQGCSTVKEIEYNESTGKPFDEQPANLQLPRKTTVTYSKDGQSRSEVTLTETDEFGNETKSVDETTGIIQEQQYYSEHGEAGCPAEPNGYFKRYLKRSVTSSDSEAEKTYEFDYQSITVGDTYIVLEKQLNYRCASEHQVINIEYDNQVAKLKALPSSQHISISGQAPTTTENYSYTLRDGTNTVNSLFEVITVSSSEDGSSLSSHKTSDIIQGVVLCQTDTEGQTEVRTYDILGRVISVTSAPSSDYEVTDSMNYSFKSANSSAYATVTDRWGAGVKVTFDGLGRVTSINLQDDNGVYREVTTKRYNPMGRLVQLIERDYLEGEEKICIKKDYTYDGWGQVCSIQNSDGTIQSITYNPITLQQTESIQDEQDVSLASSCTTFNKFQKPSKIEQLDKTGLLYRTTTATYDNFGRPLSVTLPEGGNASIEGYDGFDRPRSVRHLDGTLHDLSYLEGSDDTVLNGINVHLTDSTPVTLGTREFDGVGRLLSEAVNGEIRGEYQYNQGLLPSSQINARGQQVNFNWSKDLGLMTSIDVTGNATSETNYNYSTKSTTGLPPAVVTKTSSSIEETVYKYNAKGRLISETQTSTSHSKTVDFSSFLLRNGASKASIGDRTLSKSYNIEGQLTESGDSNVDVKNNYDSFGRLTSMTAYDGDVDIHTTTMEYDEFSREIKRTIEVSKSNTLKFTYSYDKQDRLTVRNINVNGATLTEEYDYDTRGRLVKYAITQYSDENLLPKNEFARAITAQSMTYDELNNLKTLHTTLLSGEQDSATFEYDIQRLNGITHSLTQGDNAYPQRIELHYDADGNLVRMVNDGQTHYQLDFNALGQMIECDGGHYNYDAYGQLLVSDDVTRHYLGTRILSEYTSNEQREFVSQGSIPVAEKLADETVWLQADSKHSVVGTLSHNSWTYTPYSPSGEGESNSRTGFNGELKDTLMEGTYPLGNGTRSYLPGLGIFTGMDSLSPFGEGGLNPYRYCNGDPVNFADPSGHMSIGGIIGNIIGVIGAITGIVMAIPTGGASLTLSAGATIMLGVTELAATATSIGLSATGHNKGANIAGGVAMLAGFGSGALGVGTARASGGAPRIPALGDKSQSVKVKKPVFRFLYKGKNSKRWHSEDVSGGGGYAGTHMVHGADVVICGNHLETPLKRIARRNSTSEVTIYSGVHGTEDGDNWLDINGRIIRNPRLSDSSFFRSDKSRKKEWRRIIPGRKLNFIEISDGAEQNRTKPVYGRNSTNYSYNRFSRDLSQPGHHIMAFCFGRNDEALLHHFNLSSVTSYD